MRNREAFTIKDALSVLAGVFLIGGIITGTATLWQLASMIPMFTAEITCKLFIVVAVIACVQEAIDRLFQ